jgi:hypothetical protein
VGYSVQLLSGNVVLRRDRHEDALAALRQLDLQSELKSGWHRDENGDRVPHWAFVSVDLQTVQSLSEALQAIRFLPNLMPDGDIRGVTLEGDVRSRGDEYHLWSALAPFVVAGGEMDWCGEDGTVWRWAFDGRSLTIVPGQSTFAGE